MTSKALLTVSIGPVHAFIAQARRIADQWAASELLSHLAFQGIRKAWKSGGEMVFPYVEVSDEPKGLPNRFVCRVPRTQADQTGRAIEEAIRTEWARLVESAVEEWRELGQEIDPRIWHPQGDRRQTDVFLDVAWSWVPEGDSYSDAMDAGAKRYEASRLFRPFAQRDELGEKCALCGERTALPNGVREDVRDAWEEAYEKAAKRGSRAYFRENQARLCLVCFTKRIYPYLAHPKRKAVRFGDFESIGMSEKERKDAETRTDDSPDGPKLSKLPYFALVFMDGDEIGKMLRQGPEDLKTGKVEDFHRALSMALTEFAESLRTKDSPELNVEGFRLDLEKPPQLVYAGGEDVVFYCHPRDAFPLARAVRESFRRHMEGVTRFLEAEPTISAGVLFAHARRPAGLSFRDAQRLLDEKAKKQADRDAVALRLDKRSGPAVEAAFKWDEDEKFPEKLDHLSNALRDRDLASRTTYRFTDEEDVLKDVFGQDEVAWRTWLTRRLSVSGEVEESETKNLAALLTPFLTHGHPEALRIARFLGREVPPPPPEEDKALSEETP